MVHNLDLQRAAHGSRNGRGNDLPNDFDDLFPMDARAGDADHMTDEVDAIFTVGRALAQLPDDAARIRVLRWAAERFQLEGALGAAPAATTAPAEEGTDPTLSLDGLADFFPARKEDEHAALPDSELLTLDNVIPAAADPTDDLDAIDPIAPAVSLDDAIDALEIDAPAVASKPGAPAPQSRSVLHSFVHDFQRLA